MPTNNDPTKTAMRGLYYVPFFAVIAAGLLALGRTYCLLEKSSPTADLPRVVAFAGYTVVCAGVLVCLLIALLRWRVGEEEGDSRPTFTAGIAILAVGAALMIAPVLRNNAASLAGASAASVSGASATQK